MKEYRSNVVAIVYECPLGYKHTHKVKPGETFSCHGTVFLSRGLTFTRKPEAVR